MWKMDVEEAGEHGFGKFGALVGGMGVSNAAPRFFMEASRKPWTEKYHWRAIRQPVVLYEVDEMRDLSRLHHSAPGTNCNVLPNVRK